MAKDSRPAWGIDIGQAGLKALKLQYAEGSEQAVAVGFDYVPHPKILSQPDAIPEELIPQALETFLSRNSVDGCRVAISVPGRQSLSKFITLPPAEEKKVAEIVGYEAKQQIPFPLEEVIWDYQMLNDPEVIEMDKRKLLMEPEVGLFAMKRADVYGRLEAFSDRKIEVDVIQAAPVALYNMLVYDEMGWREGQDVPGGSEHYIILDMGCDDTTLIITNGSKIYIKSVRIGGNNFTRALVKEQKLSFAKAEHLKCNATKAPDPKSVFQALRPVFNDFVQEIQRSVGFFTNSNRGAEITKVLGLGNGFKLAGLQKFLQKNLDYEVVRPETYPGLSGDAVLNAPLFQENLLTFPVSYGLALQALEASRLETTLLPQEIVTERTIRSKKPWAVVAASTLLAGFSAAMVGNGIAAASVADPEFDAAIAEKQALDSEISGFESAYTAAKNEFTTAKGKVPDLVAGRRDESWLQFGDSFNACLPREDDPDATPHPRDRKTLSIAAVTSQHVADVATWYTELSEAQKQQMHAKFRGTTPTTGAGYVFRVDGTTWHNEDDQQRYDNSLEYYVDNTLVENLAQWTFERDGKTYPVGQMGISHPVRISSERRDITYLPKTSIGESVGARFNLPDTVQSEAGAAEKILEARFIVEFLWVPPETEDGLLETDPYPMPETPADGAAPDAAAG